LFNKLFDGSFRLEPQVATLPAEAGEDIQSYVQRLRDYKFPLQIIRDRDYATVGEIFTRVNSAGTPLTGAEIHLAKIVPHWRGITREFRNYRRELTQKHYDLDLTFLMRSITVIECNVPKIKKLADKIAKDHPSRAHLNQTWRQARASIDRMIRALQSGLDLDKAKFVTSKNALVPVIYCLAKVARSRPLERNALRFFLLSQLSEHYGASGESTLQRDFRALTDSTSTPRQGLENLVDSVKREAKQYYRGLKVRPDQVCGLPSKNVLVLLMYVLMRQRRATDWGTGKRPGLDELEPREIQLHHIFPFDYMNKNKPLLESYLQNGKSPADFRSDINDIANLTFLSQGKNVDILDAPPSQYLLNETTKEMRKAHFIPENPQLWRTENFDEFLEQRRNLLAQAMTRLLKRL
jgi:hypothetical protein